MKTNVLFMAMMLVSAIVVTGCSADDDSLSTVQDDDNQTSTSSGSDAIEGVSTSGDVASFTIALDKTPLSDEQITVDAGDDDYVENTTFDEVIYITFSTSGTATVEGDVNGYVTISDNDVVVNNPSENVVKYVLSGTTADGFFKLYSTKKQAIVLNGVNITNPDGAALNNQSKKRTFVILTDGTTNTLTDGTTYNDKTDGEDMKACLFSEGQLVFSGTGALTVDANCKAGIRSDDYVRTMPGVNIWVDANSGNGIRGNEYVQITGGVLNVNVSGNADKGVSTDGYIQIDGGRTTVITTGTYEWDDDDSDYAACAGIKADGNVTVNGGEVNLMSTGVGGKGISADGEVIINSGLVRVVTTGKRFKTGNYSCSPKGIKADGNITFNGGQTQVRCTGGEGSEGIESKGEMSINSGTVESYCYDDALNAKGNLYIEGGYVYARATGNDGIDANKNLYLNGGVVIAEGSGAPECGIDAAEGYTAYINGGVVVAIGGNLQEVSSSSKQASVTATVAQGTTVGLLNGSTAILGYTTPSSSTGTALMISSPSLTAGNTYTLRAGCTLTGGTAFYNLVTGCTVGSGSQSASLTASTAVSGAMGGGGKNPGGHRGGPGGW